MTVRILPKSLPCIAFLVALTQVFSPPAVAGVTARVVDLAWMAGSWTGPLGEQTLEENWTQPRGGSIASLMRFTGTGKTSMFELIIIEEEGDTLVFRVRQWYPGFTPRSAEPMTMILTEIGERRVRFEATEAGELRSLTYSRPAPESFNIDVETGEGQKFQINLSPLNEAMRN